MGDPSNMLGGRWSGLRSSLKDAAPRPNRDPDLVCDLRLREPCEVIDAFPRIVAACVFDGSISV
jgi:hypothetical protein